MSTALALVRMLWGGQSMHLSRSSLCYQQTFGSWNAVLTGVTQKRSWVNGLVSAKAKRSAAHFYL